jgi:hypothetical protein
MSINNTLIFVSAVVKNMDGHSKVMAPQISFVPFQLWLQRPETASH